MHKFFAYLRLTRPANIVTAIADILAGYAVVLSLQLEDKLYEINYQALFFLVLSTIGLYGGGVVMNDVADYNLDKIERPERPIPSGQASKIGGKILGVGLLIVGIFFAAKVSIQSAIIAAAIALFALIYDFKGKHSKFFGPLNMGLCRGGNLLLGMSASMVAVENFFLLPVIPIIYIAAITMISRGEVAGGDKAAIRNASLMYAVVIGLISSLSLCCFKDRYFFQSLSFIAFFAFLIYRPLIIAHRNPEPLNIRKAVKAGVISLIVMDAAIATCFTGWEYGLMVLALLPVSILLGKVFAVT